MSPSPFPPPCLVRPPQVNLLPQERPEDPYQGVAMRVEEMRRRDAEMGDELAMVLEGKIHRKVACLCVVLWDCQASIVC